MKKILAAAVISAAFASVGLSANVASDNASTANYPGGTWNTGSNGGAGFGAWTLSNSGNGGRYIGGTALGSPTFGIWSSGGSSTADRPFTGGALAAGQSFSVSLANTATINGEIGFQFLSGSTVRWTLKFVGGRTNWDINHGGSDFSSGQAYAANTPLNLNFTYNGGNSYSYTFGSGSGNNLTSANNLSDIDGVRFYSVNQGADQNFGFNNLSVVPEPSTYALLGLAALGVGAHAFRRRCRR